MKSSKLVLVALTAASSAALASRGSAQFSFDPYAEVHTCASYGNCTELDSGHLLGKLGVDAVGLFGTTPLVFVEPDTHRRVVPLTASGVTALDLAVYPCAPGTPDWILVTTNVAMQRWKWGQTQFVSDYVGDVLWKDAVQVDVAYLDGGSPDVYGLDSTRLKALVWLDALQTGATFTSLPLQEPILDLTAVQWDGMGNMELAARGANYLYIIDLSGNSVTIVQPTARGLIAAADIPSTIRQEVVMLTGSPGTEYLRVRSNAAQHQAFLAPWTPVGLGLGDLDLDGVTDLVVSHQASADLKLLHGSYQTGNKVLFLQNGSLPIPEWTQYASNFCPSRVADFDGDGDKDIIFAPAGTDRLDLYANRENPNDSYWCTNPSGWMSEGAPAVFHLTIQVPQAAAGSNYNNVEWTVYRQPDFRNALESEPFKQPTYQPISGPGSFEIVVLTDYMSWFPDVFHLVTKLVQLDGSGVKIAEGPGYVAPFGLIDPLIGLCGIEGTLVNGSINGPTWPADQVFNCPVPPPPPPPGPPYPCYTGPLYVLGTQGAHGGGSGCLPDLPPPGP